MTACIDTIGAVQLQVAVMVLMNLYWAACHKALEGMNSVRRHRQPPVACTPPSRATIKNTHAQAL